MKFLPGKEEAKGIAQDAAGTALEVGISTVVENLPEIGAEAAQLIGNEAVSTAVQTLTGGLLGGLAPAVFGIKMTYQQKRFERNVKKMLAEVIQRQVIITQRLDKLEPETRQKFIDGPYRDVLFDNIISENQEQKVQDNIYGYINLMGVEQPNDDTVFTFFNTLSQMTTIDLRVLRLYRPNRGTDNERESVADIMEAENIDISQMRFIKEKLYRLGMLRDNNEERRIKNNEEIQKAVAELVKQQNASNPKRITQPHISNVGHSQSYSISKLGRQYLEFMDEPSQAE